MSDIMKHIHNNQEKQSTYLQTVQKAMQKAGNKAVNVKKDGKESKETKGTKEIKETKEIKNKENVIVEKSENKNIIQSIKSSASKFIKSFSSSKKSNNEYMPVNNVDQ